MAHEPAHAAWPSGDFYRHPALYTQLLEAQLTTFTENNITSDNYESTHRYITIKKIPFQNKNNSRNEIIFERNSLNKSVILASKNFIKYIDDKYSFQANDTKINVKTNSENNNNNLESQNQNHHSFQNNEHNHNMNHQH